MSLMGWVRGRAKSSIEEYLHGDVKAGAAKSTAVAQREGHTDVVTAMKDEAARQGWLEEDDLGYLAELEWPLKNASHECTEAIYRTDPGKRERRLAGTCRYLFARTVEGVILWGQSADGYVNLNMDCKHLEELATISAQHLRALVVNSADVGENLYRAQRRHLDSCRAAGIPYDARAEMARVVRYIPRFAISYALHNKYNKLK